MVCVIKVSYEGYRNPNGGITANTNLVGNFSNIQLHLLEAKKRENLWRADTSHTKRDAYEGTPRLLCPY